MIDHSDLDKDKIRYAHYKYTDAYIGILDTYKEQLSSSVTKKNNLKNDFFLTIKYIMYVLTGLFTLSVISSFLLFAYMIYSNSPSAAIIVGAITAIISSFVTMVLSIFKKKW